MAKPKPRPGNSKPKPFNKDADLLVHETAHVLGHVAHCAISGAEMPVHDSHLIILDAEDQAITLHVGSQMTTAVAVLHDAWPYFQEMKSIEDLPKILESAARETCISHEDLLAFIEMQTDPGNAKMLKMAAHLAHWLRQHDIPSKIVGDHDDTTLGIYRIDHAHKLLRHTLASVCLSAFAKEKNRSTMQVVPDELPTLEHFAGSDHPDTVEKLYKVLNRVEVVP